MHSIQQTQGMYMFISDISGATQGCPSQTQDIPENPRPSTSGVQQGEFIVIIDGVEERLPTVAESSLESR